MMTLQMSSVSHAPQKMKRILERPTVSMDPPLPVYFFNVVSGLRDKSAKGYPVKKVLTRLIRFLHTYTLVSCF
jgi:hypothetical protein